MCEPNFRNATVPQLHTTLSYGNPVHVNWRETPCLNAWIPQSRERYALKTFGEESTERGDGAEGQESPSPLAVGRLDGRHKAEDKQTH